jgi:hypothetical protein
MLLYQAGSASNWPRQHNAVVTNLEVGPSQVLLRKSTGSSPLGWRFCPYHEVINLRLPKDSSFLRANSDVAIKSSFDSGHNFDSCLLLHRTVSPIQGVCDLTAFGGRFIWLASEQDSALNDEERALAPLRPSHLVKRPWHLTGTRTRIEENV